MNTHIYGNMHGKAGFLKKDLQICGSMRLMVYIHIKSYEYLCSHFKTNLLFDQFDQHFASFRVCLTSQLLLTQELLSMGGVSKAADLVLATAHRLSSKLGGA